MHSEDAIGVNGVNGTNGVNGAKSATNGTAAHHPLDPLTASEIETAVDLVRKEHGNLFFNTVTIQEPRKKDMLAWIADPAHAPRPPRIADVVVLEKGGKTYEGLVDLDKNVIADWSTIEGEQPLVRITKTEFLWLS